jgi:gamma-glutamylcyclotransferase
MLYYFAYGSNLHPVRLTERVPSAQYIGNSSIKGFSLSFHKRGADGSSKCNLYSTGNESDLVHGALYKIDPGQKSDLDKYEGNGIGYSDVPVVIEHEGTTYDSFTYIAQESHIVDNLKPYSWYQELVVLGARYLSFPESYVSNIERVESALDPDEPRSVKHEELLERMRVYR